MMTNSRFPTELHGRSLSCAEELFYFVSESMGISSFHTPGLGSGVMLQHLLDSTAWLSPLMMRMDIESRTLTGSSLWSVDYKRDSDTLCGINAIDKDSGEVSKPPSFIIMALCKHAINKTLQIDREKKECSLRPLPMYYLCNVKEEEGSILELPSDDIVFSVEFNGIAISYFNALSRYPGFKNDFPSI
jgi:hypothetical protein